MTKTYRGIANTEFIWHGTNNDPEIKYNGKTVNYWDVESYLWDEYKDQCNEYHEEPTDTGFDSMINTNPTMVYDIIDILSDM